MLALRRHWEFSGKDEDIAHQIYHDDAVLEFPQSGERFEGVSNFREWRRQYPATPEVPHSAHQPPRLTLVVVEYLISDDSQPWQYVVNVMEFREDRVAHERIYIMEARETPTGARPWRAVRPADPPPPSP